MQTQRSHRRFLDTFTLVEVGCCALIVELEAMGVAVDAVVVTDATKLHPWLSRGFSLSPPLCWTIALTKGCNILSIILINRLVGNRGAGGEFFGIRVVGDIIIVSLVYCLHWHVSHHNKLPWFSMSCLLVGNHDGRGSQWGNPVPPPLAQKAMPLAVFSIEMEKE
jgi:hypothetical protein